MHNRVWTAPDAGRAVKAGAATVFHVPASSRRDAAPTRFDTRHAGLVTLVSLVLGSLVVGVAASRGLAAGLVAVLAVAATLWAVRHPATGAIAIVALVPVISGMRRGLPIPGLRLAEVLAVGFSVLLLTTAGRQQWQRWQAFDWLALAYVVATFALGLFDTLARGDSLSGEDLGQLVGPLQFFLLYRAVLVALPRRDQRQRAVDWLLAASIVVSTLALLQALRVPGVAELLVDATGQDYSHRLAWAIPRANGPFPHWTMLAGYLFAIIVLCSALLLAGVSARRRRLVLAALTTSALALVLTVTLAPMLGALAGALALAWWYRRSGRVLAYLAVGGLLALLAFQPLLSRRADDQFQTQASSSSDYSLVPHTVSARVGFWTDQYLPALQGRWLTGYGPQIPPEVTWRFTESIYIALLLRGGLPLLLIYGALSVALALIALAVGRRGPPLAQRRRDTATEPERVEQALGRAVFVLIGVLAVIQLIAPYFVTTGLPHVWWILAALVAGAAGGHAATEHR